MQRILFFQSADSHNLEYYIYKTITFVPDSFYDFIVEDTL